MLLGVGGVSASINTAPPQIIFLARNIPINASVGHDDESTTLYTPLSNGHMIVLAVVFRSRTGKIVGSFPTIDL